MESVPVFLGIPLFSIKKKKATAKSERFLGKLLGSSWILGNSPGKRRCFPQNPAVFSREFGGFPGDSALFPWEFCCFSRKSCRFSSESCNFPGNPAVPAKARFFSPQNSAVFQ